MAKTREELELDALGVPHPSPDRARIPMWQLVVPLFVPPVLWLARLSFSYAMIATTCRATDGQMPTPEPFSSASWVAAGVVNIVSILIILGIGIMAQRLWKLGGGEQNNPRGLMLDVGEGRTSFMAHWGLLVSYGFLVVTIFDSIAMVFLPVCGG